MPRLDLEIKLVHYCQIRVTVGANRSDATKALEAEIELEKEGVCGMRFVAAGEFG